MVGVEYVWLRTPFGEKTKVSVGAAKTTNVPGTGGTQVLEVDVPYSEVD